ncbi:hypothetical protein [Clostridium sp. DJ247]|uniref:hypothetical protein n=1 Tax=Clostridium sp. DJ247 TaxID=2726188 RepID=UPI0016256B1E|nr:hypothetical protein [Clostridium sp. DJ247]MBC2580596.1 hypothetical protein [Clostridium sp. DJ247]
MAQFRYVYTNFWEDPKVSESFTPEDKLFFLYLLTNPHTTQIGIYRITKKVIAFEMGYSIESVNSLMVRFQDHHKIIKYNDETRELAIKNWGKFNLKNGGKPIEDCVKKEFKEIEDKALLLYVLDSINNIKIKQLFIEELIKYGVISNPNNTDDNEVVPSDVNEGLHDKDNGTCYDTSPIGGQKENKKENENKKDNIYNNFQNINNPVNIVDNVDNLNKNCDLNSSDESSDTRSTVPYDEIINTFNSICVAMPKVEKLSNARKRTLIAHWNEYRDINVFSKLFIKAQQSDFLSGRSGRWQGCSFDWLIKSSNMIKVLEGNYDNKAQVVQDPKGGTFNNFKQRDYDFKNLEKQLLGWQ